MCSGRRSLNLRRGKAVGWAFGSPDTFYAKARGPARVSAPSCFGAWRRERRLPAVPVLVLIVGDTGN